MFDSRKMFTHRPYSRFVVGPLRCDAYGGALMSEQREKIVHCRKRLRLRQMTDKPGSGLGSRPGDLPAAAAGAGGAEVPAVDPRQNLSTPSIIIHKRSATVRTCWFARYGSRGGLDCASCPEPAIFKRQVSVTGGGSERNQVDPFPAEAWLRPEGRVP